jgi:hypothetical protein
MSVFSATTIISLVFFPSTLTVKYDLYPSTLISSGLGTTPSSAYKNSINASANKYEEKLVEFISSQKYPDMQIQSTVTTIIIRQQDCVPIDIVYTSKNNYSFANSTKNTFVVRNADKTTAQNTSAGFFPTNSLFKTFLLTFLPLDLDSNSEAISIYATSTVSTSLKK